MSIGPLVSLPASVAGQALAQAHGSEVERTGQETVVQQLRVAGEEKAEAAAGVGATDAEGDEAHERDADGRRLWEDRLDLSHRSPKEKTSEDETDEKGDEEAPPDHPRPRDLPSTTGTTFDITA